jgi:hypothetical protein
VHKPHINQNWYERAAMDLIIAIGIVRDAFEASFNSRYVSLCVIVEVGNTIRVSLYVNMHMYCPSQEKRYTHLRENLSPHLSCHGHSSILSPKKNRERPV